MKLVTLSCIDNNCNWSENLDSLDSDTRAGDNLEEMPDDITDTCLHVLARLYLTLQAKNFLPDVTLQTIINGTEDINDITNKKICYELKKQNFPNPENLIESMMYLKYFIMLITVP